MRVAFDKEDAKLYLIKRRVELEEDDIVEESDDCDLLISRKVRESNVPVFGVTVTLPVTALGYQLTDAKIYDVFVTKVFDRNWGEGLYMGIPVRGLMNENCGMAATSAIWMVGLQDERNEDIGRLNGLFMQPLLVDTLTHMGYSGFVSIMLSEDGGVFGVQTGMPKLGFCAIAENIKGKLSEFGTQPLEVIVRNSWGLASILSRYPFPFKEGGGDIPLEGLSPAVEKHFWVNRGRRYKGTFYTRETLLGIASAWGLSPNESESRVLRTCRAIEIPLRQYRTDLVSALWGRLKSSPNGAVVRKVANC